MFSLRSMTIISFFTICATDIVVNFTSIYIPPFCFYHLHFFRYTRFDLYFPSFEMNYICYIREIVNGVSFIWKGFFIVFTFPTYMLEFCMHFVLLIVVSLLKCYFCMQSCTLVEVLLYQYSTSCIVCIGINQLWKKFSEGISAICWVYICCLSKSLVFPKFMKYCFNGEICYYKNSLDMI